MVFHAKARFISATAFLAVVLSVGVAVADTTVEDEDEAATLTEQADIEEVDEALDSTATADAQQGDIDILPISADVFDEAAIGTANASGLNALGGDDEVTIFDIINAAANATANAGDVSLNATAAVLASSTWNGGATANATSTGVYGGGGGDTLDNQSDVTSTAGATANAGSFATTAVLAATTVRATSNSTARGISGDAGEDTVYNSGSLNVSSNAAANAASVDLNVAGVAAAIDQFWTGGTAAAAGATGIVTGDGNDTIETSGEMQVSAGSFTSSTSVTATLRGIAIAEAASTSTASSVAINAGEGDNTVTISGITSTDAASEARGVGVAVSGSGLAATPASRWSNGTVAEATATGVSAGDGADTITVTENGVLSSSADADTQAASVAVTLAPSDGNMLTANSHTDLKTSAGASATGIRAGNGDNIVDNQGIVDVDADSLTLASEMSFDLTGQTVPFSGKILGFLVGKGGAGSSADATGIETGDGQDSVTNTGTIDVLADADLPSLGLSLRLSNGPSVNMASEVNAAASGIRTGAGDDTVVNGLVQDPDSEPVPDDSEIISTANSSAFVAGIGVTGKGLFSGVSTNLDLSAESSAIATGDGSDEVSNWSSLTSDATSLATNVALLANMNQPAEGEEGNSSGYAKVSAMTSSAARAHGIDTSGDDTTTEVDLGIGLDDSSAGVNFRRSTLVDDGSNTVSNHGEIDVDAYAQSDIYEAVGQQKGSSVAKFDVTASAEALGILTGGGADVIDNTGTLAVDATTYTDVIAASVVLGTGRAAVSSGGNDVSSTASGIVADSELRNRVVESAMEWSDDEGASLRRSVTQEAASGDDVITNAESGIINVSSLAEAYGVDVAATSKGQSSTSADASSVARSHGILAGGGSDTVTNDGALTVDSRANTGVLSLSITADIGLATAWSGANSATAETLGIDGDSDFSSYSRSTELSGNSNIDIIEGEIPALSELVSSASLLVETAEFISGGDDTITNSGDIDANAAAVNVTLAGAGVVTKGAAAVFADSAAAASSTAIKGGVGGDIITNSGSIDSDAVANADSVGVAVTTAGAATALNKLLDGGTIARATSIGIEGDGATEKGTSLVLGSSVDAPNEAFAAGTGFSRWVTSADGEDEITNHGTINSTAVSVAPAISVAVSMRGVAGAISTATAEADSYGIQAGGGADVVNNHNQIIAGAVAQADAINFTVAPAGVALAADALIDGGTRATARASGIDTDGAGVDTTVTRTMVVNQQGASLVSTTTESRDSGDDTLNNHALVRARATSVVPSIAVAYSGAGVAGAISTAESNAFASALDTGAGSDTITNSEGVSAVATGNADTLNVGYANAGVAVAADAVWSGGATTNVKAIGINADGDFASRTMTTSMTGNTSGIVVTHETEETAASGNDTIMNNGYVTAVATAVSPSIGMAITPGGGVSVVATQATANADATAIDAGAGADDVTNTAELTAVSTANADVVSASLATGVAVGGNALWDGGVTANSNASGIRAQGVLSRSRTFTLSSVDGADPFSLDEEVVDDVSDDVVTSSGVINATSNAVTIDRNGAIAPYGVAAAVSTATANSSAFGIESGIGNDTLTNTNSINAFSNADALAINTSGTVGGLAMSGDAVWDGGTTADSRTDAIASRGGNDTINNSGYLNVNSLAVAGSGSVELSVYGVAAGTATSTARSDGTGIDSGAGDDTITTSNTIDVESFANADVLNVALNKFGVAASFPDAWDGGGRSEADAQGVEAGDGMDTVTSNSTIDVHGNSVSVGGSIPFTIGGVAAAITTSSAESDVEGIDGGAGDDSLTSNGSITSYADATAVAATGSIGVFGVALASDATWDGGTDATAWSDGIAGEEGEDTITSNALIDVDARARANSVQVAFSAIGVAAANSTSSSLAESTGLNGGAANDTVTNNSEILSDAFAHSTSVGVDITGIGAAGSIDAEWDGGTGSDAKAHGMTGGTGDDTLTNTGSITATAESDADSVQVAATANILSVATASSTADASASAIDGEDGVDSITNSGSASASTDADAQAAAIAITLSVGASGSDPFLENATTATATTNTLDGGSGDDTIDALDGSSISATATALARDNDVSSALLQGFSKADAWSIATANSTGVTGGDGNDTLNLDGSVTSDATSTAYSRSFALNLLGANIIEADTTADANAIGVDGGAGDDTVTSLASITVTGSATNLGRSAGSVGGGAAFGLAASDAKTLSHGIALGDGANTLDSSGNVTVNSTADVTARSFGIAGIGFSRTDAEATATANSYGVSGGSGLDDFTNNASVSVTSNATADARDVNINIVGAGVSGNLVTASSTASGVAVGEEADVLTNNGSITATAASTGEIDGGLALSVVGAGISDGFADIDSHATGAGMGDGDDTVNNAVDASIEASATSTANTSAGVTVTVAGYSDNDLSTDVVATSTGIAAGSGNNVVTSDGHLGSTARADSRVDAPNVTVAGAGGAVVGSNATATANGMTSESGADTLVNNGSIEVGTNDAGTARDDWMATLDLSSSSFTFAGADSASTTATAATTSTGIDSGAGIDDIDNIGDMRVFANAYSTTSSSSVDIFGTAKSAAGAGATGTALGVVAGDGDDVVDNGGSMLIRSRTFLRLDNAAYTLGGVSGTETNPDAGNLSATARASGMDGNAGADTLRNSGALTVQAVAGMDSDGNSETTFGVSSASATSGATATAWGIRGGAGDDVIFNEAIDSSLDVAATVDVDTGSASYTFAGSPDSNTVVTGDASAFGATGGDGADTIESEGAVSVTASTTLQATGGARSFFGGGAASTGKATTTTAATGFEGGDGNDTLISRGPLSVVSESNSRSNNTTNSSAAIVSNTKAEAKADATSAATGFDGGSGDNTVASEGDTFVEARSSANAVAYANGATVSITGTARGVAESTATATATGITAGRGENEVDIGGNLTVSADAGTTEPLEITVDVLSIDPNANPDTVEPTEASDWTMAELPTVPDAAYNEGALLFWNGEHDEDGDGPVDDPLIGAPGAYYELVRTETADSQGNVVETWEWEPRRVIAYERSYFEEGQETEGSGRGHGTNGNGVGTATGITTATAKGVVFGDGNNALTVSGTLTVQSDANSAVTGSATGSSTGDATANATTEATASATGIVVGDGNNSILNTGDISVTARTSTMTAAEADKGDGICVPLIFWEFCIAPGNATRNASASRDASAAGIVTGGGNNTIKNAGSIRVVTQADASDPVSVVGIRTGSGDDTIINAGLISALSETLDGTVIGHGAAIDTGAGSDYLSLQDGSQVIGTVTLGEGDDTLVLAGNALVTDYLGNAIAPDAGSGSDHLVLSGEGSYPLALPNIESATKEEDGAFWLPALSTMSSLTIDGGTLELGSSYNFAADGSFNTFVHSDGSRGLLSVAGDIVLDGAVGVERRGSEYLQDGARFVIVEATDALSGSFSSTVLPEATPLLSFELQQTDSSVDIVASTESMAIVAADSLQVQLGGMFDGIAERSTGELNARFGAVQQMNAGFDEVFDGLSPDAHLVSMTNTIAVTQQMNWLVREHLGEARAVHRGKRDETSAYSPVSVYWDGLQARATDGSLDASSGPAAPASASGGRAMTWLVGFGASGSVKGRQGYTDYEHDMAGFALGMDYRLGPNVVAGFAVGHADSQLAMADVSGRADVELWSGMMFASAFSGDSYVEGGYFAGKQDFHGIRRVAFDDQSLELGNTHHGEVSMMFLGAGHMFRSEQLAIEPYVALNYFDIDEDGFVEEGDAVLNQVVDTRSSYAFTGELGSRFSWFRPAGNGMLDWHGLLAYNRDFGVGNPSIRYAFGGSPMDFIRVDDRNLTSSSLVFGGGVSWVNGRTILSLDYRGQANGNYDHHMLGARFSYAFR